MNRNTLRIAAGGLALGLILFQTLSYQVREGQQAILLRFGRPVAVHADSGLHFRLPWPLEKPVVLDTRHRVFNTRQSEMLTRDKKNVILLTYAVWHPEEVLRYYQSVGTIEAAESKLDGLITNAKISVLGRYDLSALVSTRPEDLANDEIEAAILAQAREQAIDKYGIAIQEIGFKRVSLPETNTRFVFDQMRSERRQYAARYKAEGEREATKIRAETDLEVARLKAEATEEAARTRGEAEAEAARIYAEAHRMDPGFYSFMRSLSSLEKVLGQNATVVLRTDAEPFNLLKGQEGK